MNAIRRWGALSLAMIIASLLAFAVTPTKKLADRLGALNLSVAVPEQFGDWAIDERSAAAVVNPQQAAVLSRIYSQTLSRTYVNVRSGAVIMLAIAYGEDQRDGMQMHYPEACYPAQGFQIGAQSHEQVRLSGVTLPVKRLVASMGANRIEPISYWIMIGDKPTQPGWRKKVAEMRYGLQGLIADGLLFRVSSIGSENAAQYRLQEQFLSDLFTFLPARERARLFGAPTAPTGGVIRDGAN